MLRSMLVVASLVTVISTADLAMAQSGSRGGGGMFGSGSRSYAPAPSQSYGNQSYGSQSYGSQSYGNQSYGSQSYGNQSYGAPVYRSQGYSYAPSFGGGCSSSGRSVRYYAPVQSGCGASSCGSSCGSDGLQYAPSQFGPMRSAPSQHAPMQQSPAGSGTSSSTYQPDHNTMRFDGSSRLSSGENQAVPARQANPAPIQHNAPPRPDDSAAFEHPVQGLLKKASYSKAKSAPQTFAIDSDRDRQQTIR